MKLDTLHQMQTKKGETETIYMVIKKSFQLELNRMLLLKVQRNTNYDYLGFYTHSDAETKEIEPIILRKDGCAVVLGNILQQEVQYTTIIHLMVIPLIKSSMVIRRQQLALNIQDGNEEENTEYYEGFMVEGGQKMYEKKCGLRLRQINVWIGTPQRLRWFRHVQRMPNTKTAEIVFDAEMGVNRGRCLRN